jgi:hypothetical protein
MRHCCLALTPPILVLRFSSSMPFPMMPSLLTLLALVNPTAASVGGGGGSSGAPWPAKVISWWYASGMNEVVQPVRAAHVCKQVTQASPLFAAYARIFFGHLLLATLTSGSVRQMQCWLGVSYKRTTTEWPLHMGHIQRAGVCASCPSPPLTLHHVDIQVNQPTHRIEHAWPLPTAHSLLTAHHVRARHAYSTAFTCTPCPRAPH